jgi:predicted RNA-binding protein associated with RNAse of E/G family
MEQDTTHFSMNLVHDGQQAVLCVQQFLILKQKYKSEHFTEKDRFGVRLCS